MSSNSSSTPRSSSWNRSKRSTTNLANLRLAPLTAKYTDDSAATDSASLDGGSSTDAFTKLTASHRSAPTSPRILSRSSSRRYLGGLSRRSSLYENERDDRRSEGYAFGGGGGGMAQEETRTTTSRLDVSGGQVPKAKSEAALGVPPHQRQRLSGPGVQVKRKYDSYQVHSPHRSRSHKTSGATTPRVRVEENGDDDWLAHTGRAASGILQEQKGTSFLSVQTAIHVGGGGQDFTDDDDEDDEGYEEMAALSAMSRSRSGFAADDELSPVSTRTSRWGSRYGSRRTSRRGSTVGFGVAVAGVRTPKGAVRGDGVEEVVLPMAPDFVDEEGESSADDDGALGGRFSSLGGIVDKIIGTNFFHTDPGLETSTSESEADDLSNAATGGAESETDAEARRRMEKETARRKGEKERLRAAQQWSLSKRVAGEEGAGWEDARWFLGRVKEAWG